ncbi:MAG: HD domain-containing protein [Chloroflexota bacterium]
MPRVPIAKLHLNSVLNKDPYLLREKSTSRTRQGGLMLRVLLSDRTGSINGVYFEVPGHVPEVLVVGRGVEVSGRVDEYRGQIQINLDRIAPVELHDLGEFLPTARRPLQQLERELAEVRATLQQPQLAQLVAEVLDEPAMRAAFLRAPAAKYNHHACVGGLLEHTLDVVRLVTAACEIYPEADRDLAVTAALLHDVGKVPSYDPLTFALTAPGILLTHLYLSAVLVEQALQTIPGFDGELRMRLLHAILAHHGKLEHGSPVVPMTLEAMIVHNADNTDGEARGALDHLERTLDDDGDFTSPSLMHDTRLYRGAADPPPKQATLL